MYVARHPDHVMDKSLDEAVISASFSPCAVKRGLRYQLSEQARVPVRSADSSRVRRALLHVARYEEKSCYLPNQQQRTLVRENDYYHYIWATGWSRLEWAMRVSVFTNIRR